MTRIALTLSLLAALAGCGVDGEPIRPTASAAVAIGAGGASTNVGVGLRTRNVSVFVGR